MIRDSGHYITKASSRRTKAYEITPTDGESPFTLIPGDRTRALSSSFALAGEAGGDPQR